MRQPPTLSRGLAITNCLSNLKHIYYFLFKKYMCVCIYDALSKEETALSKETEDDRPSSALSDESGRTRKESYAKQVCY